MNTFKKKTKRTCPVCKIGKIIKETSTELKPGPDMKWPNSKSIYYCGNPKCKLKFKELPDE